MTEDMIDSTKYVEVPNNSPNFSTSEKIMGSTNDYKDKKPASIFSSRDSRNSKNYRKDTKCLDRSSKLSNYSILMKGITEKNLRDEGNNFLFND